MYLGFGTQTRAVRSLDTDTNAPSGYAAAARPLTSISCAGREHRSLYELLPDIITDERAITVHTDTATLHTLHDGRTLDNIKVLLSIIMLPYS